MIIFSEEGATRCHASLGKWSRGRGPCLSHSSSHPSLGFTTGGKVHSHSTRSLVRLSMNDVLFPWPVLMGTVLCSTWPSTSRETSSRASCRGEDTCCWSENPCSCWSVPRLVSCTHGPHSKLSRAPSSKLSRAPSLRKCKSGISPFLFVGHPSRAPPRHALAASLLRLVCSLDQSFPLQSSARS